MRIHAITFGTALLLVSAVGLILPAVSAAQDLAVADAGVGDSAEPVVSLNLARVKHRLALSRAREDTGSLLRLEYRLSVFGVAPEIELLQGFDTQYGAVPFGGPTHADFRDLWEPKEFRAPTIPLMPILRWTFGR
jgi:hypothetical protein